MGLAAKHIYLEWYELTCGGCGLDWAVDRRWLDQRREDGKGFFCPNGCERVYRKTKDQFEIERLNEQKEQIVKQRDRERMRADTNGIEANYQKRRAAALKGHAARAKKRAAAGVCPVSGCKRTFINLQRHMKSKHPKYQAIDS